MFCFIVFAITGPVILRGVHLPQNSSVSEEWRLLDVTVLRTGISEERIASIIRVKRISELGTALFPARSFFQP
jgi:hypothetical protein